MKIKLVIAGIKWSCEVPDAIFNNALLSFASDFNGKEDINLEIRYTECFSPPVGQSITKDILEWYLSADGCYQYHLLKRDDYSNIFVSMKANDSWSDVLIETKFDYAPSYELINILLTEIIFRNRLLFHDGLVLHSSAIEYEGKAIAFTAPSGTGKTTHVRLWQEKYNIKVINDDHPAIRIIDGKPTVFGTPWAGETKRFTNISSILEGVVILEQGINNQIWNVSKNEILKEFLPRFFLPYYNSDLLQKSVGIFTDLTKKIIINKLVCKPDQEAVMLVRDRIFSNK